jgi:iron complex outermembrane receptor protein
MLLRCINGAILFRNGSGRLDSTQARRRFSPSRVAPVSRERKKNGAPVKHMNDSDPSLRVLPGSLADATPLNRALRADGHRLRALAAAAAVAVAPVVHAQAAPDNAAQAADPALGTVVVTATRSDTPLLEVPASASVVSRQDLEQRNVARFGDAVAEVPGLYVRGAAFGASFPGSGQAVLSLRGIPRTPRTLVMVDGLPINNALSGGVNVSGIALENVERVEVLRGPYSALWGGNAMGGVINFISASPDQPLAEVRGGLGSNGLRAGSAIFRKRFEGGLGVSMAFGYRESDGYDDSDYVIKRALPGAGAIPVTGAIPTSTPEGAPAWWVGLKGARPWTQTNASARFDWKLGPSTRMNAGLAWGEYEVGYRRPGSFLIGPAGTPVFSGSVGLADASTPLRIAMAETDFLTPTPSGERDLRVFAGLEHRFSGGSLLKVNLGRLEHRFGFSQAGRGAAYESGPGTYTDQPNDRTDLDVSWRDQMGESTIFTAGFSLNHSTLDRSTQSLSYWRDPDTAVAETGRSTGKSDNTALFAQTETFVGEKGRLVLGARYDRFRTSGSIADASGSATYPDNTFSRLSPKAAFAWQASPELTLRTSLGAGFRPPALLDLYSRFTVPSPVAGQLILYDASPDLKPERVIALDAGFDLALANGLQGSFTVFAQQLRDLIYRRSITPTLTRAENTGEARVDGIEASFRAPTGLQGLRVIGSYTHNFRYEVTKNDAEPGSVGKNLTDVPRTMWSLGAEYASGPWSGLLVYRHVGHVFGSSDDLNEETTEGVYGAYDRHGVASAKIGYRFSRQFSASLAIDNLTDRQYFVFAKQPGRTVFAEAAWRF